MVSGRCKRDEDNHSILCAQDSITAKGDVFDCSLDHLFDDLEIADLQLNARLIEKGIDMRSKGDVQSEILFAELGASRGHSKGDSLQEAIVLL